ncbi:hypothetical protein F383_31830 [Gossypium arboreum]|uniref:Uncharacterized protein n=1 Tax=Gossypium arboreum TaxID=29729 RepID=A0A0B0MVV8_GOSAR|nr:hypothetical protein F383_31830 [Gossypium arboreum]
MYALFSHGCVWSRVRQTACLHGRVTPVSLRIFLSFQNFHMLSV